MWYVCYSAQVTTIVVYGVNYCVGKQHGLLHLDSITSTFISIRKGWRGGGKEGVGER